MQSHTVPKRTEQTMLLNEKWYKTHTHRQFSVVFRFVGDKMCLRLHFNLIFSSEKSH